MLKLTKSKKAAENNFTCTGNLIIFLNIIVYSHKSKDRLADLVAEHLDHLHYLNDILCLAISDLNDVLCEHLLNNLFLPLYVFSLSPVEAFDARLKDYPRINTVVSLFLLSQVCLHFIFQTFFSVALSVNRLELLFCRSFSSFITRASFKVCRKFSSMLMAPCSNLQPTKRVARRLVKHKIATRDTI